MLKTLKSIELVKPRKSRVGVCNNGKGELDDRDKLNDNEVDNNKVSNNEIGNNEVPNGKK